MQTKQQAKKTAIRGLFLGVIIVLQLLSYFIKIGTFNLSLVLIPIILSACLYGYKVGAFMGFIFGVVVYICCIFGLDGGGFILFSANPLLCGIICIVKGTAAGLLAGLINKPLAQKDKGYLGVLLASITAPVVNTGLFLLGLVFFFKETLYSWAAGTDIVYYMIFGLTGINFIIELLVNIVLSSAVYRVIKAVSKI